ncbi:MAG TPA: CarD family transcriptional regulator [Candidatus Dojkabacteria bacterium]|nr:CarD family transcriptional regulator [Candidatus Dojkabacteria bacterium]HRO64697.1 CarD family transcriptional regulator [Candidatus Dojkabacteria bacterium]HRP37321.1 CarD family transcriptional regulator [Candidatus Dojkabacteria bacterium]HRP50704.1 CarD family transcriptional regulator [Candidatus Dojkabacteria bacterium]
MYKINDTIVYPIYGCGKIKDIHQEEVGGNLIEYFELEFPDTNISISIPTSQTDNLCVRKSMKKEDLKTALKNLWKKVKLDKDDAINMDVIAKEHLNTGTIEDAIKLINMIKASERTKSENNKALSFSDDYNLKIAINFVRSEVEHVLGKKAAKENKLTID